MPHNEDEAKNKNSDIARGVRMSSLKSKGYSDRDAVLKSNKPTKKAVEPDPVIEQELPVEDEVSVELPEDSEEVSSESYAPTLTVEVDQLGGDIPEVGSQMNISGTAVVKGLIEKEDGRQCVEFELADFEVLPGEEMV